MLLEILHLFHDLLLSPTSQHRTQCLEWERPITHFTEAWPVYHAVCWPQHEGHEVSTLYDSLLWYTLVYTTPDYVITYSSYFCSGCMLKGLDLGPGLGLKILAVTSILCGHRRLQNHHICWQQTYRLWCTLGYDAHLNLASKKLRFIRVLNTCFVWSMKHELRDTIKTTHHKMLHLPFFNHWASNANMKTVHCQTTVHYIHITCVACLLKHRCPQTHYRQLMDSVQLKMHTSDKQCWLLLQATGKLQKVNAPYICALHMGHQWKMVQFMSWCYSPMVTGQWLHLATYTDLCPCGET